MNKNTWMMLVIGLTLSACGAQTATQAVSQPPIVPPPVSTEPVVSEPSQNPYAGFATRGPAFFETMPITGKTVWPTKNCDQLGIREMMKAVDFNAAMYIVASYRGKLQLHCSFGYSDQAANKPAVISDTMGIESVSKLITANLILQAVSEGKFRLDTPLTAVVPYYKPSVGSFSKKPTVLDALRHRIGYGSSTEQSRYINNYMPFAKVPYDFKSTFTGNPNSVEGQIWYYNTIPLEYEPGTQQTYSGAGYVILSAALEAAYGKSYMQILQEKFMNKLNVTRIWNDGDTPIIPDRAWRYKDNGEQRTDRNTPAGTGASGLIASPLSILKIVEAFDFYEQGKNSLILDASAFTNYITPYRSELVPISDKWYGHFGVAGIGSISLAASNADGWSVFIGGTTLTSPSQAALINMAESISQISPSADNLWLTVAGKY